MKQSAFEGIPTRGTESKQFWIVPKELFSDLDREFKFDFDPCPFPRNGFDGLKSDWGSSNFVNPPYAKIDGIGYCSWEWKTIEEVKKGNTIILLKPVNKSEHELYRLNPEIRCLGRIPWEATDGSGDRKAHRNFIAMIFKSQSKSGDDKK
jgi:hypothetical protein